MVLRREFLGVLAALVPGVAWARRRGGGGGTWKEDHFGTRRNYRPEKLYRLPRARHGGRTAPVRGGSRGY